MGQECFYRENRKDREEREVLLTERVTADGGQMLFRIRPMSQRENEDIWKRCGEDMKRYEKMVLAESVVFLSVFLTSFPKGHSASNANLIVCRPNGMPMIVIIMAILANIYSKAIPRPPKINQMILPINFISCDIL